MLFSTGPFRNLIRKSTISHVLKRNKISITRMSASETSKVQRPTPILLVRTVLSLSDEETEWSKVWQKQFNDLGYSTVDAAITLPSLEQDKEPLSSCYQELKQATSELSFFPPLMISHGEIAWRISEKFVSNKPVSGLVLVQDQKVKASSELLSRYPTSEFEPHFPLLMISTSKPPEFLDGWIDHVDMNQVDDGVDEFHQVINWMDQVGM